jgi:hypothetical protein
MRSSYDEASKSLLARSKCGSLTRLAYLRPIGRRAVTHQLHPPIGLSHPERTVSRLPVNLNGFIRETGQSIVHVHVKNISTDGCRFESQGTLETATAIWAKIEGLGARRARIAWNKDQTYGCEFIPAMDLEDLHRLIDGRCSPHRKNSTT